MPVFTKRDRKIVEKNLHPTSCICGNIKQFTVLFTDCEKAPGPPAREIWIGCHGSGRDSRPKTLDLLERLLQRRGEVLSKDQLVKALWPDCVVEEIGLARNVSILRKALGEDAESYIEPHPRGATASRLGSRRHPASQPEHGDCAHGCRPPRACYCWSVSSTGSFTARHGISRRPR
jgi:hypothetical protein